MFKRVLVVMALIAGASIVTVPLSRAQSGGTGPRFEVASIRRCRSGGRGGVSGPPAPGRITVNCISLMSLIRQSYILFENGTMKLQQVKLIPPEKSPGWVDSELYTVEAKAEVGPGQIPPGQGMMLGPMMQVLLQDRFQVRVHREIRQVPVYELTVGKRPLSLQPAAEGGCVAQNLDQPLPPPARGQRPGVFCGMALISTNGFDLRGATMEQFCTALTGRADRKIIDKTGVSGTFDIHMDWFTGDRPSSSAPPPLPPSPDGPPAPGVDPGEVTANIRTALQKLGLNLKPALGPGDFLVIDHVERPSEN